MTGTTRRQFIQQLAVGGGALFLGACSSTKTGSQVPLAKQGGLIVPEAKPAAWDPIGFNRKRGNVAGVIPAEYLKKINGPNGKKLVGMHLPHQPDIDAKRIPAGYLALMFGDPQDGYDRLAHKAPKGSEPGVFFHSLDLRKAEKGAAADTRSTFSSWPELSPGDTGRYQVLGKGKKITDDQGRLTIYLVRVPKDVHKGDMLRVWGFSNAHGEYIDFLEY